MKRLVGALALSLACAGASTTTKVAAPPSAIRDTVGLLVPAGFGSLRQDEISIRLSVQQLQVRAFPLDETVIRLLSPDSYRAMHDLVASQRQAIEDVSRRSGLHAFSLWYVEFFGQEQGETRFSPMEFIISSVGREFRPLEVIPLTTGFGQQRLSQRERQSALYVFDPQIDVNQPLTVRYETAASSDWTVSLSKIERERAVVRSRAGLKKE
jgi:hypothetical protein